MAQRKISFYLDEASETDLNVDVKVLHQKDTWGDNAIKGLKVSVRTSIAVRILGGKSAEEAMSSQHRCPDLP
jgi:hypothetical protein